MKMHNLNCKQMLMVGMVLSAMIALSDTYYYSGSDYGANYLGTGFYYSEAYKGYWRLGSTSGTLATSAPSSAHDYVVPTGTVLCTPQPTSTGESHTFGGKTLTVDGGRLLVRNPTYDVANTFTKLILKSGEFGSYNERDYTISGPVEVAGNIAIYEICANSKGFIFNGDITGTGTMNFFTRMEAGDQTGTDFLVTFANDTLKNFTGTIACRWQDGEEAKESANDYHQTVQFMAADFQAR